jgi:hypothetical protein
MVTAISTKCLVSVGAFARGAGGLGAGVVLGEGQIFFSSATKSPEVVL